MTGMTLNANARLTDALERDLLREAMQTEKNTNLLAMLKQAGTAVAGAVMAVVDYIDEVHDAMNRARAASAHYTGSQW
ncbi:MULTISPECIES: hypothetical protein [unclassified Bordetella]|uniref:hypothetical protein n=1 Tax=unclassified Bordetella TaxID=2630031 RepID=UPI001321EDBC|nr:MULTISPECIES: hypothetical protein [unclassified Bordetella]MVW70519.1 hypothetical protein [Bordetella sp. 15P40C-2]MVW78554.1 hypothetical protein [Bordetella sp. 02P26C-1]